MIYDATKHKELYQTWELFCLASAWVKEVENNPSSEDNLDNLYSKAIYLQAQNDCGFIMPSHMFYSWVRCGSLTDYDGHGAFLDWDGKKQKYVQCSSSWLEDKIEQYPFVIWFNK